MATAVVLPTSMTRLKHLSKNLQNGTNVSTDINNNARTKFQDTPATATDTKHFSKQSQRLSLQSKSLFENALSGNNNNTLGFSFHSDPCFNNSRDTPSPRRSPNKLLDAQRVKKYSDVSRPSARQVSFFVDNDNNSSQDGSSRKSSSDVDATVGQKNEEAEQVEKTGFFVPSFMRRREEELAAQMKPKIDPVLIKHRELEEKWASVAMGLQTRHKFQSDHDRITEWNDRKSSLRPIRTMPLM